MTSSAKKQLNHILLVEDSPAVQDLIKEAFKTAKLESWLHLAANGRDALHFLKKEGPYVNSPIPDLVLLDLNLPGKSGIEILEEIRNEDNLRELPVIILTGSNAPSDIQACSKFRCKYLLKPTHFHELVELVQSLQDLC